MVEESDTEHGLDHYDQKARQIYHQTTSITQDYNHHRNNQTKDIGEADDLYINTTSVSKSRSKAHNDLAFASHSD